MADFIVEVECVTAVRMRVQVFEEFDEASAREKVLEYAQDGNNWGGCLGKGSGMVREVRVVSSKEGLDPRAQRPGGVKR